ncbi:MAG: TlpA family protein disulfide reductase [Acidobacteriia bacterium]|nr:TlpA family protein disulfide reductase [Terriglobia bacterium]
MNCFHALGGGPTGPRAIPGSRRALALIALALWPVLTCAQQAPPQTSSDADNKELAQALQESGSSAVDIVRILEAFLAKHPASVQRPQIERALARASVDLKDDRRIVLYGEPALKAAPDDMLLLDRVARAFLTMGGRENAEKSLQYSKLFEQAIRKAPAPEGREAGRKQDERDRGLARALVYEARAQGVLGKDGDAEKLAAEAFGIYPSEESAREWSDALVRQHREKDALPHLADAFAIPDAHSTDADRADDRRRLGELYRKLHHNEKGLGDVILEAYDRTSAELGERRKRLEAIDPNMTASEPMQFSLGGLDGKRLALSSLKGSVVILDFWATWCQPCRAQHPLYEQVKQRFKGRSDVVFLAIDTDDDHNLVAPFLKQLNWSAQSVYFEDGLQRLLQVTSIPTTVLFDKQGRVASRMNGFLPDKFVDQLSERIQSALSQ